MISKLCCRVLGQVDNYVLVIRNKRIVLNSVVSNSILKLNVYSNKYIFTKKGVVIMDGFSGLDQLGIVT